MGICLYSCAITITAEVNISGRNALYMHEYICGRDQKDGIARPELYACVMLKDMENWLWEDYAHLHSHNYRGEPCFSHLCQ